MGALPRADLPAGAHRDLVDALHDLHHRAGWPSLRRIAGATEFSHTTVSAILSSGRPPAWDALAAVVSALDGDAEEFHERWLAATTPEVDAASGPLLAGRRDEVAAVARFVERSDGVLLVLAEAGMGKTSLLEAATTGHDRTVLSARCLPLARGEPMMPVAALLRAALRHEDGHWFRGALTECAPFVQDSVSVLLPELRGREPRPEATSGWAQQQLFAAVSMALGALARARPCAVVLDDVHWADSTTLGFVEYHLAHGDGPPIVAAWRLGEPTATSDAQEWRARLTRLPSVDTPRLDPLTPAATAEQLRALGVSDPSVVDRIHARSEGLPLFTEHLARHGGPADELPHGLAELLALRLDAVSEPARRIEHTLAVMNRPTGADVLPLLTGLEDDRVSAGLHELEGRHLLRTAHGSVSLSHPLLTEAVRHRMFAPELAREHHRVATALEVLHREPHGSVTPGAAEIAEHWEGAGERQGELAWRVRAAQEAQAEWGLAEAAGHWCRALDLWPADVMELDDPPVTRSSAHLAALNALREVDRERGHELARRAVAEVGNRRDAEAAAILHIAGTLANVNGAPGEARDLLERGIEILRGESPSTGLFDALFALSFVHSASGADRDAAAVTREAAELARRLGAMDRYRLAQSVLAGYATNSGDREATNGCLAESASNGAFDGDPGIAVRTAMNRVHALNRIAAPADAVLAAAAPGFAAATAWGGEYVPLAILRQNVAEALRMAGRVAEAADYVDRQVGTDLERAMADMLRGRPGPALTRARAAARPPFQGLDDEVDSVEKLALVALWAGEPAGLLDQTLDVLERTVPTGAATYAAPLLVVAARAAAETHADAPGGAGARRAGRRLAALLDQASEDPLAAVATIPTRPAHAAQWAGELARLHGRADPAPWAAAARRWDRLTRPHDAAYCRWRAAEAAAASGQATQAARLARRALADARTHEPLRRALAEFLHRPGVPA